MKCPRLSFQQFLWSGLFLSLSLIASIAAPAIASEPAWSVVGPAGGDARAFASAPGDPSHLYLGTTNSWLYESKDGGASWSRLTKIDPADGFVLDSIVVDASNPSTLFVGAWKDSANGGLWVSHDGGKSWMEPADLKGQSIHALAQAHSDPRMLFAGTLRGVYRSSDSGATWEQISPEGDREIHEVESLAIDPENPDVV